MGLSSFFRKKPQQTDDIEGAFSSRAEAESNAVRGRTRRKLGKQAAEPVDPVLPEKKRARRRLVGAVALVLAAIIGLPMILDSEPKPLSDDLIIQIPSKDQVVVPTAARTLASGDGPTNVPAGTALGQREELIDPPASTLTKNVEVAPITPSQALPAPVWPKPDALLAQSKPQSSAEQKVDSKHRSDSKPEPKSVPKPLVTDDKRDAVRARAILDGAAEPAKSGQTDSKGSADKEDKKPAHLMVQVAALASKEKVAELQDKLKAAGIVSHTQTIVTGSVERIRVRIGPFGSREEADKARSRLTGLGLTGSVVPG